MAGMTLRSAWHTRIEGTGGSLRICKNRSVTLSFIRGFIYIEVQHFCVATETENDRYKRYACETGSISAEH